MRSALRPISELYVNAPDNREGWVFDRNWLQVKSVGPNGKFHRVNLLDWTDTRGKIYKSAACSGLSLTELDEHRPLQVDNWNHHKCRMCLRVEQEEQEVARVAEHVAVGTRAAAAKARIERHLREAERAEQELAFYESLPAEPEVEDNEPNVVWFTKVFQNGNKTYTYAACKAGDGLWYTSGPNVPKGYTWEKLIEWIFDGEAANLWHAIQYNPLMLNDDINEEEEDEPGF